MKPFGEYITESRITGEHGIFIKLTPTTDSVLSLVERFPELTANDLHCTLVYTHEPFYDVPLPEIGKFDQFAGAGIKLQWFEGATKIGFVILELEAPQIHVLQQKFFDAGFPDRSDFDQYTPHVSLIFPAKKEEYESYIKEHNHILETRPLHLQFVYGGYTLLDAESTDD